MNMDDALDVWGEEPEWAKEKNDDYDVGQSNDRYGDNHQEYGSFGAHHILLLIDCHPQMFDPCIDINTPRNKDDSHPKLCPFDAAIMATGDLVTQCVRDVATTKANKRNGVGVILYGINYFHDMDRHGDLTSNFPLLPLEPPGIHQIQLINKCISKQRDLYNEFCDPQKKTNDRVNLPHPLRAALHAANKTFQYANCVKKGKGSTDLKTIWIFTNQDCPCQNTCHENMKTPVDDAEVQKIYVTAKDAKENGLQIHVYPFPKKDNLSSLLSQFDRTKFFDLLTSPTSTYITGMINGAFHTDDILEQIMQQWQKIRKKFTLPLLLPGYVPLAKGQTPLETSSKTNLFLDFYRPISIQKPLGVTVHKKNNQITYRTTNTIVKETGDITGKKGVSSQNLSSYMLFAGRQRVPIKREEIETIQRHCSSHPLSTPSLILLGFQPRHPSKDHKSIPLFHNLEKAYYAYPTQDDSSICGSSKRAFSALYQSMIRKDVMGIGELRTKDKETARLVGIVPQKEEISEPVMGTTGGSQVWPPGFVIFLLPFQNDIRYPTSSSLLKTSSTNSPSPKKKTAADKEMVDAACELIKHQHATEHIQWGFHFPNPHISKFWNYIERVALGTTTAVTTTANEEDELILETEQILKSAGAQIETFQNLLPVDGAMDDGSKNNRKNPRGKRKREENGFLEADFDGKYLLPWISMYESGSLGNCKVDQLKSFLRIVDGEKSVNMKKAALVEKVKASITNRIKNGDIVLDYDVKLEGEQVIPI